MTPFAPASPRAAASAADLALFWDCINVLTTTACAFITRAFLVNDPTLWPAHFGLNQVQAQAPVGGVNLLLSSRARGGDRRVPLDATH